MRKTQESNPHQLRTMTIRIGFILIALAINGRMWATSHAPAPRRPPDVILITIDTVRADHLGCYGNQDIRTPTLDALARDGVVFDRAISQVPLTWPSHAAILTGTYPFQNGVQDFTGHPLAPQFRSIAQAFKQAGYVTGAVVSSFVLDRSWGLDRGFDFYDDAFSATAFQQKDLGMVDRKAAESVSHALGWVKRNRQRKFFLWLHLYDPHSPYDPPEPFRTQYRAHPYDGEIAYADHELGRLIAWLKQNRLYDGSLIVVLSDHGESLGEHGESEHGFFVYNSTIHIPLIIKPPAQSRIRSTRIATLVETTAIVPTLLRLTNVHDPIEKQSRFVSLLDIQPEMPAAYSETFYPFSSFGWSPLHSLETENYHYIDAPHPELYDLRSDPLELKNLAAGQPGIVEVMKEKLGHLLQTGTAIGLRDNRNLDAAAAEKLRALGYVAYQSPVTAEVLAKGLPDPKDKLWEFNSILQAQDAFRAGQLEAGKGLLNEVARRDPLMYVVPFLLGEAAIRQENWDEATADLKRALDLNPNFDEAMTALSHALHAHGDDSGAKAWLDKAVASNPQNYRAWYELGAIQARSDPQNALQAYRKAVSIQPSFARGQRDLGIAEVTQKAYSSASGHLEKALELGLDDARLRNFLGIAYTQTNRLRKATETLQEAIRQDPSLAEAHLNLGFAYQKLRREKEASAQYEAACRLQPRFCGVSVTPPK